MTTLEIILLILGAIIFIASFIVPENKSETVEIDKQLMQEKVQEVLKEEIQNVHSQVEDTVEETVSYSMERTERALERITNEKISAVSEYTETVLSDIHKSHEEVMFLYDMLNEKHDNLKETASEVSKKVKEVNDVVHEADLAREEVSRMTQALDEAIATVDEAPEFAPINLSGIERLKQASLKNVEVAETKGAEAKEAEQTPVSAEKEKDSAAKAVSKKKKVAPVKKINSESVSAMSIQFDAGQESAGNSNERILELYKKGKSNVAIAKELGLGVGEVKLVIDLFKGI